MEIWNKHTVEQVQRFVDTHLAHLREITEAVQDTVSHDEYTRKKGVVNLDGTGAGSTQLDIPRGFDWVLQRVTVTSPGAGVCQFFENTTNPSDLLEQIANSQQYSDAFDNTIFVPGGSQLLIVFANAGANGQASYNLQVQVKHPRRHTHRAATAATGEA